MRRIYITVKTPAAGGDNENPTQPTSLQFTNITPNSADLAWTASTDNVGVSGYNIKVNGVKQNGALVTDLTYSLTGLSPGTSYNITVEAVDSSGNTTTSSVAVLTTEGTLSEPTFISDTFNSTTYPSNPSNRKISLPAGYAENTSTFYPVFLFWHGLGEKGSNAALLLTNGPLQFIYNGGTLLTQTQLQALGYENAIWVAVQEPVGDGVSNDKWSISLMKEALEDIIVNYRVDTDKIYYTGLSMGGRACVEFITQYPTVVAAAMPIAPNVSAADASVIKANVFTWFLHAADDSTGGGYGVGTTDTIVASINSGSPAYPAKYTKPTTGGHTDATWDDAYQNLDMSPYSSPGLDPMGGDLTNTHNWALWCKSKLKVSPPIASFDVNEGETGVLINSSFVITLNEAIRNIDDSELTNANIASKITFKETDVNGIDVALGATISADKKMVTVTPSANLSKDTTYYISIHDIEDSRDNAAVEQSVSFETELSTYTVEKTAQLDFSNSFKAAVAQWNKMGEIALNSAVNDLKTPAGASTQWNTLVTVAFGGSGNAETSTGTNSGIYPDDVLKSGWFTDGPSSQKISGLDPSKYYNFIFHGNKNNTDSSTDYTIGGTTVNLNTYQNYNNTVEISGIQPNASGEITYSVAKAAGAGFQRGVISALVIEQTNLPKP